jgi:putative (di)nucleoside polyphosphate hydrolase
MENCPINKSENLPYRPNVCLLIYNQNKQLLIGERLESPQMNSEIWQLPQGGIDQGEELSVAALREAHEELGIDYQYLKLTRILDAVNAYDFDVAPEYAKGRWRGQKQNFALISFTGKDQDLNLTQHEAEFSRWRWVNAKDLLANVEPKRRKGYKVALEEFLNLVDTGKI